MGYQDTIVKRSYDGQPLHVVATSKSDDPPKTNDVEHLITMAENFEKRVSDLRDRSQRLLNLLFSAAAFIILPLIIMPPSMVSFYAGPFFFLMGLLIILLGMVSASSLRGMKKESTVYFERACFLYYRAYQSIDASHDQIESVLIKEEGRQGAIIRFGKWLFSLPLRLALWLIGENDKELDADKHYNSEKFKYSFMMRFRFGKSSLSTTFPLIVTLLGLVYLFLGSHITSCMTEDSLQADPYSHRPVTSANAGEEDSTASNTMIPRWMQQCPISKHALFGEGGKNKSRKLMPLPWRSAAADEQ
ncbi:MAG: hypothetical protein AAGA39_08605 [Pseudomonadota bacterium]